MNYRCEIVVYVMTVLLPKHVRRVWAFAAPCPGTNSSVYRSGLFIHKSDSRCQPLRSPRKEIQRNLKYVFVFFLILSFWVFICMLTFYLSTEFYAILEKKFSYRYLLQRYLSYLLKFLPILSFYWNTHISITRG